MFDLTKRLRQLVTNTSESAETTETVDTESRAGPETQGGSTQLYHCEHCETTYVGESMEKCPDCRQEISTVPDGEELGIT